MTKDLPELDVKIETPVSEEPNYDLILDNLNSSLKSIKPGASALDEIKSRNSELSKLINNYKSKSEVENISRNYDELKNTVSKKESVLEKQKSYLKNFEAQLLSREARLHEEFADFEEKKTFLDTKERILNQNISSESSPMVLKIFSLVNSKISELEQQRNILANDKVSLSEERSRIKDLESSTLSLQRDALNKKRRLEQESMFLDSEIAEKKMFLDSMNQKQLDLDMVIKERSQLAQDLDRQFNFSKSELEGIKSQILIEQKVIERQKSSLETDKQALVQEKAAFEEQKLLFHKKMDTLSEKSRESLESQKRQVLDDLQARTELLNSKFSDIDTKERMFKKLEFELQKREKKLETDLELLSNRASEIKSKNDLAEEKLELSSKKEKELKSYEEEVGILEQTILDLKAVVEQKDRDLTEKESRIKSYLRELKDIKNSAAIEKKFAPLIDKINSDLDSGDVFEAQSDFMKLSYMYKSSSKSFQLTYHSVLKGLHEKISSALKAKVLTE